MTRSKVPGEVRDFVARYVTSVEQLEVFMLLQRHRRRFWSATEIAGELQIADEVAADVLEHLASKNFLDVKICSDLRYRFNPATPALDAGAEQAVTYYSRHREKNRR